MLRKPAVAGSFYPDNQNDLEEMIEYCFNKGVGKLPKLNKNFNGNITGIMVPHAGYIYSGYVASYGFYQLVESGFPDTFIILCPNHTGFGYDISVFDEGFWETPLGNIEVDNEFAEKFIKNSKYAKKDTTAHLREHSIEVELPFLQYFSDDFKILPICIGRQNLQTSLDIANAIKLTSEEVSNSFSLISSTDLSHFLNQTDTIKRDNLVLNDITEMNYKKLIQDVYDYDISMCGYGTVAADIIYSLDLGVNSCEILSHKTSGDVSGDYNSVVGYASTVFKKE
ncbi:AmmeMemoRadiSam system protein B [Methanobrevibacter sp. 87.7]|uniref:AmmeMemoRadiSam system protein B n=1 Tax=Methanobrevibacter sp. 87.7 TaxID=387957 RepID=UPI000B50543E|nr:AmmeMemoRadiSam system protein B [Methanobrevibacter sp. 87.7]OWT33015.1 AmmeMemoRadiSam system protein B [Methanobrevibacter sp. 87.7]